MRQMLELSEEQIEQLDKLEKDARAAKELYDGQQEDEYRRAAADVYANLRASWERKAR